MPDTLIIDCHCHAGQGDGLTGPWDTAAPLAGYLRRAARAGIGRTVVFAAFHSDYAAANRAVARIVAGRRGRFYGFAFLHPLRDRGRVAAMVKEHGWQRAVLVQRAPLTRAEGTLANKYFGQSGLQVAVTSAPQDRAKFGLRWWADHKTAQLTIQSAIFALLDPLYPECR